MAPIRLAAGIVVTLALGALATLLESRGSPVLSSAAHLTGERWFRVMLEDRQIGYLHTRGERDRLGRFSFSSELRYVLLPGQPVAIHQQLKFDHVPPYPLLHAEQRHTRAGAPTETARIRLADTGYVRQRDAADAAAGGPWQPLAWSFTLGEYLAFEAWLRATERAPGTTVTLASLDFASDTLLPRRYRVVEHNPTGYRIENPAPREATLIQLDHQLRPVHLSLAGLFELERVDRAAALAPRTALLRDSYHVPVDRPIPAHTDVRRLRLEVEGSARAVELWPELADRTGSVLELEAGTAAGGMPTNRDLESTPDHPAGHPRIRALAEIAVAGAHGAEAQAHALTQFVHSYLAYVGDGPFRPVLQLLDDPAGDCTEFADLLTTLARSAGIPARTVFGLAYASGDRPAFRFHAWNELHVDGRWQAFDPTWNQTRVDATHIPLPAGTGASLRLLTGTGDLKFVVRDAEYWGGVSQRM
jgi:transglutaminase-like putative cysteine protease